MTPRFAWVTKVAYVALVLSGLAVAAFLAVLFGHNYREDLPYKRGPAVFGMPFEDVYINTQDNVKLHGWLIKQPEARKAPTFICFQGNYGYQGFRLPHARALYDTGVNILLVDYRGFGRSEGSPTEKGVYKDADAALDFILNSEDVNNEDIFVLGHSLGGAVAVDLAYRRGKEIKGLVLENAFTSLKDIACDAYPQLRPFKWLVGLMQKSSMSNIDKIGSLTVPTFFLCGREDRQVPPEHTDRLFEACSSPIKWLESAKRGTHYDSHEEAGDTYWPRLQEFMLVAKATNNKQLGEEGGESVGTAIKKRDQGGDKRADEVLKTHAQMGALVLSSSIIAYLCWVWALHEHRRSRYAFRGGSSLPKAVAETAGLQLDHHYTDSKFSGASRDWQLVDDESTVQSHFSGAEVQGVAEPTNHVALGDSPTM